MTAFPPEIERGGWSDNPPDTVLLDDPVILVYGVLASIVISDPDEPSDTDRLDRLNRARTFRIVSASENKPYHIKRSRDGQWVTVRGSFYLWYEREEYQPGPLTERVVKDFVRRCQRISGDDHHIFFEGLELREVRDGTPVYDVHLGS